MYYCTKNMSNIWNILITEKSNGMKYYSKYLSTYIFYAKKYTVTESVQKEDGNCHCWSLKGVLPLQAASCHRPYGNVGRYIICSVYFSGYLYFLTIFFHMCTSLRRKRILRSPPDGDYLLLFSKDNERYVRSVNMVV